MIIDDLHIIGVTLAPLEADSPPLIDSDTVLPFATSGQLLKAVTWRPPQIRQLLRSVENEEFAARAPYDVTWKAARLEAVEDLLRLLIPKAPNHAL